MSASCADRTASRTLPGRVDDADRSRSAAGPGSARAGHCRVEARGGDVFVAAAMIRRPMPPSRAICSFARWFACSPQGTLSPPERADVAPPYHRGSDASRRTPARPGPSHVLGVTEGSHELVRGIERRGREPRVGRLRAFDVELGFVAETNRAPSVGSPTTLPSTSLASLVIRRGG